MTATALLSIGAVATVTGSAYAQPMQIEHNQVQPAGDVLQGEDHGVGIATGLAPDANSVVSELNGGTFALSGDGKAVTATADDGTVLDTMPLAYQAGGHTFDLTPQIDETGRKLTLTPVGSPTMDQAQRSDLQLHFVDYASDLARHQYNAGVGALIGGGVGALIGMPFFGVGMIPGAIVGALVGAGIGWVSP
ncbi:DUF6861 domain-containing protein [Nocardia sp. NPDC051321]|uniref:DUF6861 domain-containing protein n=1 Tax=Nocardia sp. NPDC051321 TaxID=3364323 RepID=UPI0037AF36EF